jgi:ribosomal protein S18 acetylase RimI-like enzyme
MGIEVRKMNCKDLADRVNVFQYESNGHYRVSIREKNDGWTIELTRENFPEEFHKKEFEKIVTDYKGKSEIHFAFVDGKEAGFIQFEFQEWNQSVRVWDIDILPEFRRNGIGRMLMDMCITRSRELGARRIILETQTSNLKAIAFYRAMGFELVGLDASNYHNDDIARNEVRLEMALHLD